jgi:hypothetical protein
MTNSLHLIENNTAPDNCSAALTFRRAVACKAGIANQLEFKQIDNYEKYAKKESLSVSIKGI